MNDGLVCIHPVAATGFLTFDHCFRLSGIGSIPGYPDCKPWDDWKVGRPSLIVVSHLLTRRSVTHGATL